MHVCTHMCVLCIHVYIINMSAFITDVKRIFRKLLLHTSIIKLGTFSFASATS